MRTSLILPSPNFRTIVTLDPKNVDAQGNLGVLLFSRANMQSRFHIYARRSSCSQSLSKIQALLGIAEKRTGDIKSAQGDLEKAFPNLKEQKIRIETGTELIGYLLRGRRSAKGCGDRECSPGLRPHER